MVLLGVVAVVSATFNLHRIFYNQFYSSIALIVGQSIWIMIKGLFRLIDPKSSFSHDIKEIIVLCELCICKLIDLKIYYDKY